MYCFPSPGSQVSPTTVNSSFGAGIGVSAPNVSNLTGAAVHQMPSIITKPKLFVTQPQAPAIVNVGAMTANGPIGMPTVANGTHQELRVLKDGGKLIWYCHYTLEDIVWYARGYSVVK